MKKLIVLIAFLGAFGILQAQEFNPLVGDKAAMKTKVITPFSIWDITPNTPHLGDVIKGQTRTYDPENPQDAGAVMLFQCKKESNYTVTLKLSLPNPTGRVTLLSQWYFLDQMADGTLPSLTIWPTIPKKAINSTWTWYDVQTDGFIALLISSIDATDPLVSLGTKTFTAKAVGSYVGL